MTTNVAVNTSGESLIVIIDDLGCLNIAMNRPAYVVLDVLFNFA